MPPASAEDVDRPAVEQALFSTVPLAVPSTCHVCSKVAWAIARPNIARRDPTGLSFKATIDRMIMSRWAA